MIRIIAGATMREAIRSRTFVGLMALYLGAALLSRIVGWISGTDGNIITASLVLSLQSLFGVLVAVATGTALVQTEIQQKTLYTILSRPVPRWQFVVGKFLGLVYALAIGQFAMLAIGLAYLGCTGVPISGWLVVGGLMTLVEVLLMAGISLAWTSLSTPLLAVVLCLVTYALGHAVGDLPDLMWHLHGHQADLCVALAALVPDLSRYCYRDLAVHGVPLGARAGLMDLIYAGLWMVLLVTIAVAVLRRKQL
jgi:ABC-type transport system involved in multi-copper enzyme maturation permease subunit